MTPFSSIAIANLRAGRVVQGGSTLTQQLVKNYYLTPERTFERKLREAVMSLVLDYRTPKVDLLEAYLTEVYLGQAGRVAVHGFGSASRHYFAKRVGEIDLAESALLAGMVRGPSQYSPYKRPEAALERRNLVLRLMLEEGLITDEEHAVAEGQPLGVQLARGSVRSTDYFLDYVSARLPEVYEPAQLEAGGLSVFTSLDVELQALAERAVRDGVSRLEEQRPGLVREESPLQAALVAIEPASGEILAMVGGRDYVSSQFNRAADARRQPGSVFKPIVTLTAISRRNGGDPAFHLASTLLDSPFRLTPASGLVGATWAPQNYGRRYRGPVSLRTSLEKSLNVPMARLGVAVGSDEIIETARRLGIQSPLRSVPSIALGSNEVTLLEVVRAYSVLANGGLRPSPGDWTRVLDEDDHPVGPEPEPADQVFARGEAYLVTSALRGVVERGTARSLPRLGYTGSAVGKTGTTNGLRDAWFVGYTPELAVGAWVGFDDGHDTGMTGGRAALPIFAEFVVGALGPDGGSAFEVPDDVEQARGCGGRSDYFLVGTERGCGGAPRIAGSAAPPRRSSAASGGARPASPAQASPPRAGAEAATPETQPATAASEGVRSRIRGFLGRFGGSEDAAAAGDED